MNLPLDPLKHLSPTVQAFLKQPMKLMIDNQFVDACEGKVFQTFDPATSQLIANVSEAGIADVEVAVASANRALVGPWAKDAA
jgi:acyl-CoA reductase-like NAD-dependent aldehyde dehydrogenase